MKFSCSYDDEQSAQKKLDTLRQQGRIAWITRTPDGKSHVFWMASLAFPQPSSSLIEHPLAS